MTTEQTTEQVAARFAGRLRELRRAAGLTRKELAARAGLASFGSVRNLEQGVNRPLWATVLALAEALGVGVEAFAVPPAPAGKPGRGRPRRPALTA